MLFHAGLKACSTLLAAQLADDFGYVIFLEQADGGYAGCAGLQAGLGVVQGYSSEGQDGDFCAAGLSQSFQTGGLGVFFFEDWGEDGEGGLVCRGLGYFLWVVTGDCYQRISL